MNLKYSQLLQENVTKVTLSVKTLQWNNEILPVNNKIIKILISERRMHEHGWMYSINGMMSVYIEMFGDATFSNVLCWLLITTINQPKFLEE